MIPFAFIQEWSIGAPWPDSRQVDMDADKIIACFEHYLALEGQSIARAAAEQRMLEKLARSLSEDIDPLLPAGIQYGEKAAIAAFNKVWEELIVRIKGKPWKLTSRVIDDLRQKRYPGLMAST